MTTTVIPLGDGVLPRPALPLSGAEILHLVQDGTSRGATISDLRTGMAPGVSGEFIADRYRIVVSNGVITSIEEMVVVVTSLATAGQPGDVLVVYDGQPRRVIGDLLVGRKVGAEVRPGGRVQITATAGGVAVPVVNWVGPRLDICAARVEIELLGDPADEAEVAVYTVVWVAL